MSDMFTETTLFKGRQKRSSVVAIDLGVKLSRGNQRETFSTQSSSACNLKLPVITFKNRRDNMG